MKGSNINKNSIQDKNLTVENIDAQAYSDLYDKYVASIYRYIYFKINITEIAQDLTGDTFLKTWQYLQKGNKIENIKAFFYQTASNLVTDYYRSSASKSVSIKKAENIADIKSSAEIDKINLTAELKIIKEALKQINETYKEIIVLYFIEQLSISEIAKIKEKSEGAIRVLIHRALKSLKSNLPKEYMEAMQKVSNQVKSDNATLIENAIIE